MATKAKTQTKTTSKANQESVVVKALKTEIKPATERKNTQNINLHNTELAELQKELQRLKEEKNQALLDLGKAQQQISDQQATIDGLRIELSESSLRTEKRDVPITLRITKSAFNLLSDYATNSSYNNVSRFIAEILCETSFKKEKFEEFIKSFISYRKIENKQQDNKN